MIPRTKVEEVVGEGELFLPLDQEILSMQASADGELLTVITSGSGRSGNLLTVYGTGEDMGVEPVWQREVKGFRARWVGGGSRLVYEDGGDIWLLDLAVDEPAARNLTESEAFEEDPLPSPHGDYILWTVLPPGSAEKELWYTSPEAGKKSYLAPWQEMVAWDPAGDRIMSASRAVSGGGEDGTGWLLQEARLGSTGWNYFLHSDEEVRYLWWTASGFFFVAPRRLGEEGTRAVWFKVEPSGRVLREASTDGLGEDAAFYVFYPARDGGRIAYAGEKGLEVLDLGRELIQRYPAVQIAPRVVAWMESENALLYAGEGGIHRLALR